jgi:hypothetical protein
LGQAQGSQALHVFDHGRASLRFLLHRKCNLGLATLIFGLRSFCGRSISFICHRHSTPSIQTDQQYVCIPTEDCQSSAAAESLYARAFDTSADLECGFLLKTGNQIRPSAFQFWLRGLRTPIPLSPNAEVTAANF